jgi:hypothetical protein
MEDVVFGDRELDVMALRIYTVVRERELGIRQNPNQDGDS